MTNHSHDVTLIHRRDSLRAEKILQDRLFAHPNIKIIWDSEVAEFVGGGMPEALVGLDVRNVKSGAITRLDVDGAFVAIGHKPATELFQGKLKLDSDGYIEVETGTTRTSVEGVFACGDVMDKIYRQAVTAAGTGCMAALDAEKFLAAEQFGLVVELSDARFREAEHIHQKGANRFLDFAPVVQRHDTIPLGGNTARAPKERRWRWQALRHARWRARRGR